MSDTETFTKTMELRLVRRPHTDLLAVLSTFGGEQLVLQQAWRGINTGAIEWRDVPIVDEERKPR